MAWFRQAVSILAVLAAVAAVGEAKPPARLSPLFSQARTERAVRPAYDPRAAFFAQLGLSRGQRQRWNAIEWRYARARQALLVRLDTLARQQRRERDALLTRRQRDRLAGVNAGIP